MPCLSSAMPNTDGCTSVQMAGGYSKKPAEFFAGFLLGLGFAGAGFEPATFGL